MNTSDSYGMSYAQVAELFKHFNGQVRAKRESGLCSVGKIHSFNKRNAWVMLAGGRIEKFSLSELKPPAEYNQQHSAKASTPSKPVQSTPNQTAPKSPKEPAPMPPSFAPRPTPTVVPVSNPPAAPMLGAAMGSNIVVLAAQLEAKAREIQAKRADFGKIEQEYLEAKALRDSYAGDVEAMEQEYRKTASALKDATAALLSGVGA